MASTNRDRRSDGRPEQDRPRDRTGRPLARGTQGVLLAETHEPGSREEAFTLGVSLWNQRRYFEAHECLEIVWKASDGDQREFWQGIIQVAVAAVHLQRDNPDGGVALATRASKRLEGFPEVFLGVDVGMARRRCELIIREAGRTGFPNDFDLGRFPSVEDP